jgi:hypothetical protein
MIKETLRILSNVGELIDRERTNNILGGEY